MIRGILVVLALALAGGWVGAEIGGWWVESKMRGAEMETMFPPVIGLALGALVGGGIGIAIAYALGRREID